MGRKPSFLKGTLGGALLGATVGTGAGFVEQVQKAHTGYRPSPLQVVAQQHSDGISWTQGEDKKFREQMEKIVERTAQGALIGGAAGIGLQALRRLDYEPPKSNRRSKRIRRASQAV